MRDVAPLAARLLALLVLTALACWGSYRHGRSVEAGAQALQRQADIVATHAAVRADVSAQAHADADRLRRSLTAAQRIREIDREAAAIPPRDHCSFTAAELRLAEQRWCARYADTDPARCLPHAMPAPADPGQPPDLVGTADRGLGSPVPRSSQQLR